MKRLILLTIVAIGLSSCGTALHLRDTQTSILYIDYTPYTEAGFFLSPNDYPGPHTPIGEINIIIDPEVKLDKSQKKDFTDGIYQSNIPKAISKKYSSEELLEVAVREALNKKGTGISNLKIQVISDSYTYYRKGGLVRSIDVNRYIITGVVIKTN